MDTEKQNKILSKCAELKKQVETLNAKIEEHLAPHPSKSEVINLTPDAQPPPEATQPETPAASDAGSSQGTSTDIANP